MLAGDGLKYYLGEVLILKYNGHRVILNISSIFKAQIPKMKKILILAQILFVLTVCGQKPFELNYRYSIDFKYSKELPNDIVEEDSIIEKPGKKQEREMLYFILALNQKVKDKALMPHYDLVEDVNNIWDCTETDFTQFHVDSMYVPNEQGDMVLKAVTTHYDFRKTAYLRLAQEWYYDTRRRKIEVVLNGACPVFEVFSAAGDYKGTKPMYWHVQTPLSSFLNPSPYFSDTSVVWAHKVRFQLPVLPTATTSSPFYNARYESSLKKMYNLELPALLFTQAINKQIEIYSPQSGNKMTVEELKEKLVLYDTLYNIIGEMQIRPIRNDLGMESVSSILVNQTFIFDPKNLLISSRINSMIVTCKPNEVSAPIELFEVRFNN